MKLMSLAVLCLVLISGCKTVDYDSLEIGVDPILAQHADNYPITKKKAFWSEDQLNVNMGPYQVNKADQGSMRTNTSNTGISALFDFDRSKYTSKQRLNFDFTDSKGSTWAGRCEKQFQGSNTEINSVRASSIDNIAYKCDFKTNSKHWKLTLQTDSPHGAQAYIESQGEQQWTIETFRQSPDHRFGARYHDVPGFYIVNEGMNIVAVSLTDEGQFWVDQELSNQQKDTLAMSALGLWYLQNGFGEP